MLGGREPETYGSDTLASINQALTQLAQQKSVQLESFQSNTEGEIVDCIQQAAGNQFQFIIIAWWARRCIGS